MHKNNNKVGHIRRGGKILTGCMLLITALLVVLFASCTPDNSTETSELCDVMLSVTLDKTLESVSNKNIYYWEFMATPRFSLASGEGKEAGRVDYWRRLSAITSNADGTLNLETSLGKYMQGEWYYELRALNKRGHVIAVGQTTQYISKIQDNVVNISVYTDSADGTHGESMDETSRITGVTATDKGQSTTVRYGTVKIGFLVNQLEYDIADMRITTSYQKVSKFTNATEDTVEPILTWDVRNEEQLLPSWYLLSDEKLPSTTGNPVTGDSTENVPQGKIYYGTDITLDAGRYLFTFNIETKKSDGTWQKLGGQSLVVVVIGGEQSEIRGTLTANTYIVSGILITVPGTIYGSINGQGQNVSVASNTVTLEWTQSDLQIEDSNETATEYTWYIDGVEQTSRNNSITFECPKDDNGNYIYGVYRVSLVPLGSLNSWGFTDIDIAFVPES